MCSNSQGFLYKHWRVLLLSRKRVQCAVQSHHGYFYCRLSQKVKSQGHHATILTSKMSMSNVVPRILAAEFSLSNVSNLILHYFIFFIFFLFLIVIFFNKHKLKVQGCADETAQWHVVCVKSTVVGQTGKQEGKIKCWKRRVQCVGQAGCDTDMADALQLFSLTGVDMCNLWPALSPLQYTRWNWAAAFPCFLPSSHL